MLPSQWASTRIESVQKSSQNQCAALAALGLQRTVQLVCSQKTLSVAIPVINALSRSASARYANPGMAVVPCVMAHLVQTILGTLLVAFWTSTDKRQLALDSNWT